MSSAKRIFVTGATGNVGGAAVRHLLQQNFYVKALVRDTSVTNLTKHDNLAIVKGDLNDPSSYEQHLNDIDGVFCNLTYEHGVDKEIKQGLGIIDVSKRNNVKHFIYCSVIGNDLNTGIPHWESKSRIEDHLKQSGLNFTILRPGSFYENLLRPQVKSRILKGKLVLPTRKDKVQQFISTEDVGRMAIIVFSGPGTYYNKTLNLAADQMNGEQLATLFSKVMKRNIKFQQLPGFIVRLVLGRDLAKMFRWVNNNDVLFVKDIESFRKEFPGMMNLEKWIKIHFGHP